MLKSQSSLPSRPHVALAMSFQVIVLQIAKHGALMALVDLRVLPLNHRDAGDIGGRSWNTRGGRHGRADEIAVPPTEGSKHRPLARALVQAIPQLSCTDEGSAGTIRHLLRAVPCLLVRAGLASSGRIPVERY